MLLFKWGMRLLMIAVFVLEIARSSLSNLPGHLSLYALTALLSASLLSDDWVLKRFHASNHWLVYSISGVMLLLGCIAPLLHYLP